ncbi:16S rRNA (cytosine(1402)-N(4))-methyltransferase RsmH [Rhodoligotrophos defluvii]|uniref:16S rRNA (cytosine(1402)-N(4))-methyltransferase RsmH n=1 Tax=Rhodoligotrophos defluvii TaxID=2561934 RepID=UPI0010C93A4E|nr:16S rRNA (cytosine(1402)-N(4))-methyltransferase RsmH [Rhodoligotrophos defluvii]
MSAFTNAGKSGGHVPVLLAEVLAVLAPGPGEIFLDGTFGAGGYSRAILNAAPDTRVLAIDRDIHAIREGEALVTQYPDRLKLVPGRFSEMEALAKSAGADQMDGVALDVGVSSMQLDRPERGFSFLADGPLDMRMGRDGPSAADVVAACSERQLADIVFYLGEERKSRAIARAIVKARAEAPIVRTLQLADIVEGAVGGRRPQDRIHPATRTFQALRILVNDELGELARGLGAAERLLKPGGRLAVVSFHSLEDRIVKRFFATRTGQTPRASRHLPETGRAEPSFAAIGRGATTAGEAEIAANPRARSAKLRAGRRTQAPALPVDLAEMGVPAVALEPLPC